MSILYTLDFALLKRPHFPILCVRICKEKEMEKIISLHLAKGKACYTVYKVELSVYKLFNDYKTVFVFALFFLVFVQYKM